MPATAAQILARVLGAERFAELAATSRREPEPRMTPDEQATWNRQRAVTWHERHTDPEFAHLRPEHPDVIAWANRYITDPHTAGNLLILGPNGTGKTGNCYGALRAIAESGLPPIRRITILEGRLYALLRPNTAENQAAPLEQRHFDTYATTDVLFVDDVGSAKPSEWTTAEGIFPLVYARHAKHLPTLLTSNLQLRELEALLGPRTSSRLKAITTVVAMEGPDRRNRKKNPR